MPTIKEIVSGLIGGGKEGGEKEGEKTAPTAEQLTTAAAQATIQELREQGLLRDKPVAGTEQAGSGTADDIKWDNLDVTTEAGRKAYAEYLASPDAQKPIRLTD